MKIKPLHFIFLLFVLFFEQALSAQTDSLFLYKLTLAKQYKSESAITLEVGQILGRHGAFMDSLGRAGRLISGGRILLPLDDDRMFGIAVIKATNMEHMKQIVANDPGVVNGVQIPEIYPFSMGIRYFQNLEQAKTYPGTHAHSFDFWLGAWELTWSDTLHGTNLITSKLGGNVVHEQFNDPNNGFIGESWSMFNPTKQLWEQTWVDNQGAYMTFTGGMFGDEMILSRKITGTDGAPIEQRMVFCHITPERFDWRWEASADNGITWKQNWLIHYTRKK